MDETLSSIEGLIQDSIVHIYNYSIAYDHVRPWKVVEEFSSTSTGFCVLIDGVKYILTNAHCLASSVLLQIQPYGSAIKYTAKIRYVMPSCDLGLVEVKDPHFWSLLKPVKFNSDLPAILQTVYVVGYPMDGTNISFTQGVISRIITTNYMSHGYLENIAIQIDAAINSGNSGGPVIDHLGQVVGVAFQSHIGTENMGEIIPIYVYDRLFLTHFRKYGQQLQTNINIEPCELNINYQTMDNPDLRKYYQMSDDQTGILVTYIPTLSNLIDLIQINDIIMAIDDINIESNGTVLLPENKKVYLDFNYLITNYAPDQECQLTIFRNGQISKINLKPKPQIKNLKGTLYKSDNQYLIIGGIVFIVPNLKYTVQLKGKLPCNISTALYYSDPKHIDSEIIVASCILPCEANIGYVFSDFDSMLLLNFNDQKIRNLKHLAELYDNNQNHYIKLEFSDVYQKDKYILIMSNSKVIDTKSQLLKNNMIGADRSENLFC